VDRAFREGCRTCALAAGSCGSTDEAPDVAPDCLELGASMVAFNAGAREAGSYTSKGSWARPVSPVTVVDAVGAGDGFATD